MGWWVWSWRVPWLTQWRVPRFSRVLEDARPAPRHRAEHSQSRGCGCRQGLPPRSAAELVAATPRGQHRPSASACSPWASFFWVIATHSLSGPASRWRLRNPSWLLPTPSTDSFPTPPGDRAAAPAHSWMGADTGELRAGANTPHGPGVGHPTNTRRGLAALAALTLRMPARTGPRGVLDKRHNEREPTAIAHAVGGRWV